MSMTALNLPAEPSSRALWVTDDSHYQVAGNGHYSVEVPDPELTFSRNNWNCVSDCDN